jgi:hypothetical protein
MWSWARMPSYLSSIQASSPTRRITSAASATGEASMNRIGRPTCSAASRQPAVASEHRRLPDLTGQHVGPAHLGELASKAAATASSSSPSRRPIRGSRDRTRPMKRASSALARASSMVSSPTRSSARPAAAMAAKPAATSAIVSRGAAGALTDELRRRVAEVGVAQVGGAQLLLVGAGRRRQRRALLDPSHAQLRGRDPRAGGR